MKTKKKDEITESHLNDIFMTIKRAIIMLDHEMSNKDYLNSKISSYCDYLKDVKLVKTNK